MAEILVVDDEEVVRTSVRATLRRAGYVVTTAEDGVRGLVELRKNPRFDLVITDLVMPELDGTRLIAAMQDDSRFENIPTLIMSGNVCMTQICTLLEAGASRFLAKPVLGSRLLAEVHSLLEPQSSLDDWTPPSVAVPHTYFGDQVHAPDE